MKKQTNKKQGTFRASLGSQIHWIYINGHGAEGLVVESSLMEGVLVKIYFTWEFIYYPFWNYYDSQDLNEISAHDTDGIVLLIKKFWLNKIQSQ